MKWDKFKSISPCCSDTLRKHHDIYGLEIFYCVKCGKLIPILEILLTDGMVQKSMEEFIIDVGGKGILNKINER